MKKIASKIRLARTTRRVTQGDLARAVGVSDKSISAYESGRVSPPLDVLERIATSTDHTLQFFFDGATEQDILSKLTQIQELFTEIKTILKSSAKTRDGV